MDSKFVFLIIGFVFLSLTGFGQINSKTNAVQKQLPDQTLDSTKNAPDYAGFYRWNDYVQMYLTTTDTTGKYLVSNTSVVSDLYGEFFVMFAYKDAELGDSMVMIKYLYYMRDSRKGRDSANSAYTNLVYFLKYNFQGNETDFNRLLLQDKVSRNFGVHQKYFIVRLSVFKAHAFKIPAKIINKASIGFGVLNYPFKYRIQKGLGDFSGSFNVGAAVAYTYRHDSLSKWRFSHVLGFGISSITLDKASVTHGADTLSATNGLTALTFSYGFMISYDKVQIGVFLGVDRLNRLNNDTYGWKYQGKPWISIGLGYSIFSTNSTSQQQKTDTQPD